MPQRIKPEQAQKSAPKNDRISSMMDDAPLFAGLDNFVLPQAVTKPAKTPPVGKAKEKKKKIKRPSQEVKSTILQPKSTLKAHQTQPLDQHAVVLTVAETCTLLKISRATLIRMDNSGKLPGKIKLGGSVRFHRETIETWLRSLISSHPTP